VTAIGSPRCQPASHPATPVRKLGKLLTGVAEMNADAPPRIGQLLAVCFANRCFASPREGRNMIAITAAHGSRIGPTIDNVLCGHLGRSAGSSTARDAKAMPESVIEPARSFAAQR
jgi:hypothetical protein